MNNKYFYQIPHAESVPFDNIDTPFVSETVQDAIEESYNNLESRLNFPISYGQTGVVTDDYLQSYFNLPSDTSPLVMPFNIELLYITFVNANTTGSLTIYIYTVDENIENQQLLYSITVNGRSYYSPLITDKYISQGYGIQIRIQSLVTPKPSNPIVTLLLRAT